MTSTNPAFGLTGYVLNVLQTVLVGKKMSFSTGINCIGW